VWNQERMLSFDHHSMGPYLAPAGDHIEVEVVSMVTGKHKTLAELTGKSFTGRQVLTFVKHFRYSPQNV